MEGTPANPIIALLTQLNALLAHELSEVRRSLNVSFCLVLSHCQSRCSVDLTGVEGCGGQAPRTVQFAKQ